MFISHLQGRKIKKYSVTSQDETVQESQAGYQEGNVQGWKLSDASREYVHSDGSTWSIPSKGIKGETYQKLIEIIENSRVKNI